MNLGNRTCLTVHHHNTTIVWQPLRMLFSGNICLYSMLLRTNVTNFRTFPHVEAFYGISVVCLSFFFPLPKSILHFQNGNCIFHILFFDIDLNHYTAPVMMQEEKHTKLNIWLFEIMLDPIKFSYLRVYGMWSSESFKHSNFSYRQIWFQFSTDTWARCFIGMHKNYSIHVKISFR